MLWPTMRPSWRHHSRLEPHHCWPQDWSMPPLPFSARPCRTPPPVNFARRFGDLETHPFIPGNPEQPELVRFAKSAEVGGYENSWHSDVSWRECPSMGAVLHAVDVPSSAGDTLFADMGAAFDGLDEST